MISKASRVVLAFAGALGLASAGDALGQMPDAVGRPSAAALATARQKENSMRDPRGPESVTLNPDEMASLIQANLQPPARRALDSLRVRLQVGRLALDALLVTSTVDTQVLGPIALMLEPVEPVSVAGAVHLVRSGIAAWQPDSFVIRSFPFPQATIPTLVRRITGSPDGSLPIYVPESVRQIRVRPSGVTFSRRVS